MVKVSPTQVYTDFYELREKKHGVDQCLHTFIKIMKRLYGSEKNWFKALGGLTVAVTIDPGLFKRSVAKVLRNTSHISCTEEITRLFQKESQTHNIEWKGFMKVVYDHNLLRLPIKEDRYNFTCSSFASVEISKILF